MSEHNEDYYTKLLPCPNFKVCGQKLSEGHMAVFGGRCCPCDMYIGTWCGGKGNLDFRTIEECCICLETNIDGVSCPRCSHYVCVKDFKKMYKCLRPTEMEILWKAEMALMSLNDSSDDESDDDGYRKQWLRIVFKYTCITGESDSVEEEYYESESEEDKNLRRCPLCRE